MSVQARRVGAVHERRARHLSLLGDTTGMPLPFRGADDTQLSGAFIVDPPGAQADPIASSSSPSGPASPANSCSESPRRTIPARHF